MLLHRPTPSSAPIAPNIKPTPGHDSRRQGPRLVTFLSSSTIRSLSGTHQIHSVSSFLQTPLYLKHLYPQIFA